MSQKLAELKKIIRRPQVFSVTHAAWLVLGLPDEEVDRKPDYAALIKKAVVAVEAGVLEGDRTQSNVKYFVELRHFVPWAAEQPEVDVLPEPLRVFLEGGA